MSVVLTLMHCANVLCRGEGGDYTLHDASQPISRAVKDADHASQSQSKLGCCAIITACNWPMLSCRFEEL